MDTNYLKELWISFDQMMQTLDLNKPQKFIATEWMIKNLYNPWKATEEDEREFTAVIRVKKKPKENK